MANCHPPQAMKPDGPFGLATILSRSDSNVRVQISAWTYRGLAIVGACTILAGLSTLQKAAELSYGGGSIPWTGLVIAQIADWYTCGIFMPAILWLSARFQIGRFTWTWAAPIHALACAFFAVVKVAIFVAVGDSVRPGAFRFTEVLSADLLYGTLAFVALTGLAHALLYHADARRREQRAIALDAELANARLDALRAQLNPHFLFNTLNAVSALIASDPKRAEAMVESLSDLLRDTLHRPDGDQVTLAEEVALLRRYALIMVMRFGERLDISYDIDQRALALLVPQFLLQPLVENAIEAGVSDGSRPTEVRVIARLQGDHLKLVVEDNGAGIASRARSGHGIGLANTRRRIEHHFGDDASVSLETRAAGGTRAEVILPAHFEPTH